MKTSTPIVKAYRERQAALGRSCKNPYLTDEEWEKVRAYIKSLRKANKGKSNDTV